MGWKLNMIIMKGIEGDVNSLANVAGLYGGFKRYEPLGNTTLEECLYPQDDYLYIGIFKDLRIIVDAELPYKFFNNAKSPTEKLWGGLTKGNKETYVFVLHSVANIWGYSKINEGNRIRTKYGNHDEGVIHEEGDPLFSEIELLQNSQIVDGRRVYFINNEEYNEDQMGEEFVFRIIHEITGQRIDRDNDLLATEMAIFKSTGVIGPNFQK